MATPTIEQARKAAALINDFMSHWDEGLASSCIKFPTNFQDATVDDLKYIHAKSANNPDALLFQAIFQQKSTENRVPPVLFQYNLTTEEVTLVNSDFFWQEDLFPQKKEKAKV